MFFGYNKANVSPKPMKTRNYAVANAQAIRLTIFILQSDCLVLVAIATTATAKVLIWASVFRFVTEDLFLTYTIPVLCF